MFEISPIVPFFWRALPISKMCVLLRCPEAGFSSVTDFEGKGAEEGSDLPGVELATRGADAETGSTSASKSPKRSATSSISLGISMASESPPDRQLRSA